MKILLTKAKATGDSPNLAMVLYHSIPLGSNLQSTVKLLYGWKDGSNLPMSDALRIKVGQAPTNHPHIEVVHLTTKNDKNQLNVGQPAMLKTPSSNVVSYTSCKHTSCRSYEVIAPDGAYYGHARFHLKSCKPLARTYKPNTRSHTRNCPLKRQHKAQHWCLFKPTQETA